MNHMRGFISLNIQIRVKLQDYAGELDQEEPAYDRTYKYSQLLFSIVKFTIVM